MYLYTVYDSKAKAYLAPMAFNSQGESIRAWETTVNQKNNSFNMYPSDFTLFEIAKFDPISGELTKHEHPINLGLAAQYVRPSMPQRGNIESIKSVPISNEDRTNRDSDQAIG